MGEQPRDFGPNHALVDHFLTRIAHAPTLHWLDAAKRWADVDETAGGAALFDLSVALERSGRFREAEVIARRVREYVASIEWLHRSIRPDIDRELVERARSVATAAAWALALRGTIDESTVRLLYSPWDLSIPLFSLEREGT